MRGTLYPLIVVAKFLGKKPEELKKVMKKEDGLPVMSIPARTKPVDKVSILALHRWLKKHSSGDALTVQELAEELEWAAEAVAEKNSAKRERRELRTEQQEGALA